jgi:deoxycytidine triphosphate deaminase
LNAASGTVLNDTEIRRLVAQRSMIGDFDEALLQGASYDLRLGPEYSTGGRFDVLSDHKRGCTLEPGQFVLLTSWEQLALPVDVVARAGLVSRRAQQGLISLFSPQIDPGFIGLIVVPLFNAGNDSVTLKLGEPIFTVEFVRMLAPASFAWSQRHHPLLGIPEAAKLRMARPDFHVLEREIEELRARLDGYQQGKGERIARSARNAAWIAIPAGLASAGLTVLLTELLK